MRPPPLPKAIDSLVHSNHAWNKDAAPLLVSGTDGLCDLDKSLHLSEPLYTRSVGGGGSRTLYQEGGTPGIP